MSNDSNNKKKSKLDERREIREQCFAVLFEMSFSDDSVEDILDNAVESRMIVADDFMTAILDYYTDHSDEVDELIKANIKGWTINRLSKVTLSVLRLAICELRAINNPHQVVINEAIEIAKKYATPKEASFVNGVLGAVVSKDKE